MTTRRMTPVPAAPAVRMPAMPSWWVDDEEASESSQAAMRQM
jgi:hypothetical protein